MNGAGGKSLQTKDVLSVILSTPGNVSAGEVAAYDAIAIRLSR